MPNLREFLLRAHEDLAGLCPVLQISADTHRGGVRSDEVGIFFLYGLKFVHQMVIVVIAHRRSVIDVVLAAVFPEDFPELADPYFGLFPVHCMQLGVASAVIIFSDFRRLQI